jgi:hypothetical protein
LILLAVASTSLWARERQLSRNDLPVAVRKTADEQVQGATVRGYSKEIENGQVEYEVRLVANGHLKDITIAPDGRVLEIEEEVPMESLPVRVTARLKAKAGKGSIAKVESLTKGGKVVAYEAQVVTAGKHSEIQVEPDGSDLIHPE